jgi:DNA ligase D-like protein (predicted ligase)/DNA ligase D-like protein (predicted polymerase)/DNA ligase D-like protein (predicted 3'-phosphoesterase)
MAPRKSRIVSVGRRKVELSNLDKALFPDDEIVKAQVIEYYFTIAPTILAHLKGRPLSVIRFPDGIAGESFFQKDRPKWAPEWIEHIILGEEQKDYVLASEEATLVWLANLACIELHQMPVRSLHFDKPDYIVYDFDPPQGFRFQEVIALAFEFKNHLESLGYSPFVKTTGRKGLHILTPIEPKWTVDQVFNVAKLVAEAFIQTHPAAVTLQIKKEHRKGKVLLDIYRNRQSQTIIAAYSLRGSPGAPVSTPIHWEELQTLEKPGLFNLHTIPDRVRRSGDPWETMASYATAIHTDRKRISTQKKLAPARTYKTPEQLNDYSKKRRFEKTTEPVPAINVSHGSRFVVHRHHASRLHYDLRLEHDGVLKSWAVPKGLPSRPGIMRLAMNVEDHPLEYVEFEGAIPKGEYGGGMMWKFAQGRYEIAKKKKDGFYFRLHSREVNGEYRIHNTKENQWLLERVDNPQTDWLRAMVDPMLARAAERPPESENYVFEVKWDGIRTLVSLDEGAIKIRGRNGLDITDQFPELNIPNEAFRATCGLFDGEIVCLDADGRPNFANVIHRMQQKTEGGIRLGKGRCPAVCYLFDCLYLDGRSIMQEPLVRRREWLQDLVRKGSAYRMSEAVDDGPALFQAVKSMSLEGIMAKQRSSVYQPGKRSDAWFKIKARQSIECVIIGYSRGKGERENAFGALHLARLDNGCLKYIGKVGSGFEDKSLAAFYDHLSKLPRIKRPVREKPDDDAQSVWIEPSLVCEVQYASLTKDGVLREPVFLRLRPDLTMAALNVDIGKVSATR